MLLFRRDLLKLSVTCAITLCRQEQAQGASVTFAKLPSLVRSKVNLSLKRSSVNAEASPFASLISGDAIYPQEDPKIIQQLQDLGVKHVLLYNFAEVAGYNSRVDKILDYCEQAGIEARIKLNASDPVMWQKTLSRLGQRIHNFYYLNEPNIPRNNNFQTPLILPEDYVQGLAKVYKLVKKNNPNARLFGLECATLEGMEERPFPWIPRAIRAGLLDYCDGIGIHPYRQPYGPNNPPERPSVLQNQISLLKYDTYQEQIQILQQMVHSKPINVTEVGWSTAPRGSGASLQAAEITELTQAKFALRQQILDFGLGMELTAYFMLRDRHVNGPYPKGNVENSFGIVREDGSFKIAYSALQALYAQLDSKCILNRNMAAQFSTPNVYFYVFDDLSKPIPCRKVIYWLPAPAADDFPIKMVNLKIGGVNIPSIPLSDAPCIIQLHRVNNTWGYPILFDLIHQKINENLPWN